MNCEHFHQRMHLRLDDRLSLDSDPELIRHAEVCTDCGSQLHAWRSIESVLGPALIGPALTGRSMIGPSMIGPAVNYGTSQPAKVDRRKVYSALAVAGLLFLAVGFVGSKLFDIADQVALSDSTTAPAAPIDIQASLDAAEWWATIRDRDWLAQTMPAVRSVQKGVAPLGRSLIQAVTILTVGDPSQTS